MVRFQKGTQVIALCYKPGCENVQMAVTLGAKEHIEPGVSAAHLRFDFPEGSPHEVFSLSESKGGSGYCNCPNCNTLFGDVVIITPSKGDPIIHCYDPEPA